MLTVLIWLAIGGAALAWLASGNKPPPQQTVAADVNATLRPKSKKPTPQDACDALKTLQAFGAFYAPEAKELQALVDGFSPLVMKELVTPDVKAG